MITLKVNKRIFSVPSLSELTFKDFNRVMIEGKANDLPSYLSIYTDIGLDLLMNSDIDSLSLTGLHERIYNVDINQEIRRKREAFKYEGRYILVKSLSFRQFFHSYFFDLCCGRHKTGGITDMQLCVFCLAIALQPEEGPDMAKVEDTYSKLEKMDWRVVLPIGFFLFRKSVPMKMLFIQWLIVFFLRLRRLQVRIRKSRKYLNKPGAR